MILPPSRLFSAALAIALVITACSPTPDSKHKIITEDIIRFWQAYDLIVAATDTAQQRYLLDSLYLNRATPGLRALCEARHYTTNDYLKAIRLYPKFWASVRSNTEQADQFGAELAEGIERLRTIYPELRPASIYFSIGALRTNGTTVDSMVLIGSELAMADDQTDASEFHEVFREGRRRYFESNPIDKLVLLNIHEYVHTQQYQPLNNLLSYALHEGVAEFVSCLAMNEPSVVPAIVYGKEHEEVRLAFEREMFYGNNTYLWLWSDAENAFGVRDLGYYIGYALSEHYYEQATDEAAAIQHLIALDYANEPQIEAFVDGTGFFSQSLEALYKEYEARRPTVVSAHPLNENEPTVWVVEFSEAMDPDFRNFGFGPLGEEAAMRVKTVEGLSEHGKILRFEVEPLEAGKHYQLLIGSGFRNLERVPLKEYLIEFTP